MPLEVEWRGDLIQQISIHLRHGKGAQCNCNWDSTQLYQEPAIFVTPTVNNDSVAKSEHQYSMCAAAQKLLVTGKPSSKIKEYSATKGILSINYDPSHTYDISATSNVPHQKPEYYSLPLRRHLRHHPNPLWNHG